MDGVNINSKQLIAKFFGETKQNTTTRYLVEKIDANTVAIDVHKEL